MIVISSCWYIFFPDVFILPVHLLYAVDNIGRFIFKCVASGVIAHPLFAGRGEPLGI